MTGFSAEWLALRAPADDAARDTAVIAALTSWAADRGKPLRIADYGGGSGAGYRALSPLFPDATWRILDNDPALLSHIADAERAEAVVADLAADPGAGMTPVPHLITGFAFFDLVSANWMDRFIALAAGTNAALYAPLTYDGLEAWLPEPRHEATALAAFNQDMRRDKGFGPALGADAAPYLAAGLKKAGYRVQTSNSPWTLKRPNDAALMNALVDGGATALRGALGEPVTNEWSEGRRAAISASIGHIDLLALPPT